MKKFFSLLSFALFLMLASFTINANEIFSINTDVKIHENGDAHVRSEISGSFYEGTEVYFPFSNLPGGPIKNLKVSEGNVTFTDTGEWNVSASREQKKHKSGIVGLNSDEQELCFGIGDYGEHTFLMEYDIPSLVLNSKDEKNFMFFKFIKDGMNPAPENAQVIISAPFEINAQNTRIWAFGYEGSVTFEGGNIVAKSESPMSSQNSIIILSEFEGNPFKVSKSYDKDMESIKKSAMLGSDYTEGNDSSSQGEFGETGASINSEYMKHSWALNILYVFRKLGSFFIWLFAVFLSGIFIKNSKSPFNKKAKLGINLKDLKGIVHSEYPFREGNMMNFSTMVSDLGLYKLQSLIGSLVMNGIVDGYIEPLREAGSLPGEKSEKTKYAINAEKIKAAATNMDENQKKFYDILMRAAGSDLILETSEIKYYFKKKYSVVLEWEKNVYNDSVRWTNEKGYYNVESKLLGISRASTQSGDEKLKQILGFKNYLEQYSLLAERSAIDTKIWDVYMVAATMMGISEKVLKQFESINPNYAQDMTIDMNTYYMINSIANSMVRSTYMGRNEARRASSRSFGGGGGASFGGGGGSFGGGGGGGTR